MRRRRRNLLAEIKLTPEGWLYLVVLVFITVGAVLRNVNLLIFMAGMMYAPLLINWRLGLRRLRALTASRRVPHRLHANETSNFQWTCENRLGGVAAWNVVVNDRIQRLADADQTPEDFVENKKPDGWFKRWFSEVFQRLGRKSVDVYRADAKLGFACVKPFQKAVDSYRIYFANRGKYVIGPAAVSTTFPFGLIVCRVFIPKAEAIFVAPEVGQLEPTWERRVQSTAIGSDAVKRQRAVEDDEFYALRPWRSGDSKKNIHWRTTAKYGEPIVKQHDQPNNRDFALVLDLFSEQIDLPFDHRCEQALSFAATAILKIGSAVQGKIAIGLCGQETEICHSRSRQSVVSEVMRRLAIAHHCEAPEIVESIFEVANLVSSGTPVYVVSSRKKPDLLAMMPSPAASSENGQARGDGPANGDGSGIADVASNSQAVVREQARFLRRMRQVEPLVRWIEVGTDEFNQMFQMEIDSAKAKTVEQLQTKWGANVRR